MNLTYEIVMWVALFLLFVNTVVVMIFGFKLYRLVQTGANNQIDIAKDTLKALNIFSQQFNQENKLLEQITKNQVQIADSVFESIQALRRQLFTGEDTPNSAVLVSTKRSALRS